VLVFEGTQGLSRTNTITRFTGCPMACPLSPAVLGRVFDGIGRPLDGLGPVPTRLTRNINGSFINPTLRAYPRQPIMTGLSAIDLLATLVQGQKLPIFSGDGLPHDQLAAQIAAQAHIAGNNKFAIVFAAMGIKHDTAQFFRNSFEESSAGGRTVLFLNLASDPASERIITPRLALTTAEYLAYDLNYDVLVIMTDMTAYAEAVREISASRGELPSRKGFPGYLYSDLASLYERAGVLRGCAGSVTQLPILTMPSSDITHPVPDLTGYITEGQIVLDRQLHHQGIYPPVGVLPSLSRLMKDAIGPEHTHKDHAPLAAKLFAAYAQVGDVRALATIVGAEDLTEHDQRLLAFGQRFEQDFINQSLYEKRSMAETIALGRGIL